MICIVDVLEFVIIGYGFFYIDIYIVLKFIVKEKKWIM